MKKSLSHAISKGLLFLTLAQAGTTVWAAEGDGIEYRIEWQAATASYHVYMRPNATPTPTDLSLSAQITLRVPHAAIAADNFVVASGSIVNVHADGGVIWSNSSTVRAPTEDMTVDYLSFSSVFSSNPQIFAWKAGEEQEVFSFKNASKCLGVVEIINNELDPFNNPAGNSAGTGPANQFTNLGWGDSSENNYLGNYGSAADCRSAEATNKPPVAVADTANAVQGTALTIAVLANDTDEDSDVLSISAVTDGDFGTVTISGDKVVYTPDSSYEGSDTFTYTVTDDKGDNSIGRVTVSVRAKDSGLDTDGDGLSDAVEADLGTNPNSADSDQDGVSDADEVKDVTAPQDTDKDGIINALDADDDGDGILTKRENYDGDASPANDDTDSDGIPDYLDADDDGDGILTAQEMADLNKDGNPDDALDSDKDGIPDYLDKNTASTASKQQLAVPTLSQWAQILLALLLGAAAFRNKFGRDRDNG